MKLARWASEIRPRRVKSGLRPGEIAPLGRLWCPFGTNKTLWGVLQNRLQHALKAVEKDFSTALRERFIALPLFCYPFVTRLQLCTQQPQFPLPKFPQPLPQPLPQQQNRMMIRMMIHRQPPPQPLFQPIIVPPII